MFSQTSTVKVGLLTIAAVITLLAIIVWKTDIFLINQGYQLTGSFNSIEGLTLGSEVRYRGFKIGKVMGIDPGPAEIIIKAIIDKDISFPADSTLRVSYDGLVGLKYLEIKPGTSEITYKSQLMLYGEKTAGIVDFVDIGSKNLIETKAILVAVRKIIENPKLQAAFINAVYTMDKTANEAEQLVKELRAATQGIAKITQDNDFQENVKGTVAETQKTLSSANRFFEGFGKLNLRASGGIDIGTKANAVKGDIDIIQSEKSFFRVGIGEGPSRRTLSVLDILLSNTINDDYGYRLGMINSQLGGGLIVNLPFKSAFMADIYDINNPRPNWPKVRLGYERQIQDYMDVYVQGDDLLNSNSSNFMLGIRVKPEGQRLY